MSLASTSPASPLDSIIRWRMRRDLIAQQVKARGESEWTLKDPLSLAYYHLRDPEFVVLSMLNGAVSYRQLLDVLSARFPGERWTAENLKRFLYSLVHAGLVTSLGGGQGARFAQQKKSNSLRRRWSWLTGWMSIRWQGIDPEPLLNRIDPWTRWLFHPGILAVMSGLILFALSLVAIRWELLIRRLPDAETMFGLGNLLPLVLVFVVIKLLHELGHVVTCRHFGGECHELGIQLLMFVPLFYGDVTDAWMQSRRWPRIAISSAGILVELVLASLAAVLWWCSTPGLLNSIFLNVMLVCSVNTLLFNGNPLLRYDGYYVLADLLRVPNLAMQSRQVVIAVCERWLFGVSDEDLETRSQRWWVLAVYGFASAVYRWFVLGAIVWFLHRIFSTVGLGVVASALSLIMVGGAVLAPLREVLQRARFLWTEQTVSRRRIVVGGAGLLGLLLALLLVPVPYSVRGPFVVYPADSQPVYVTVPGRIESIVRTGQRVTEGDIIGRLTNEELVLQLERQKNEVARLGLRLRYLETQRGSSETSSMRLPSARDALASASRRLEQLRSEVERLRILSPRSGVVLPPPNLPRPLTSEETLAEWTGTPLEEGNRGATVKEQTLLCYVGDTSRFDALVLVDQDAVEFVRVGNKVGLQFQSSPGSICTGIVEEVSTARSEALPREISVSRLGPIRWGRMSSSPADVTYEVRVRFVNEAWAQLFSPGRARINCGWLSIGTRLWRLMRNTFFADLSSNPF